MADESVVSLNDQNTAKFYLFKNVKNSAALRTKLLSGDFKCSFINPLMVVDLLQVTIAAYKAVVNQERNKMTTKTVYTEIIYNLSCRRGINNALKIFGLKDNDTSLMIAILNDADGEESKKILKSIDGTAISLKELESIHDKELICKEYDITPTEGSLLDAVLGRMATKEFANY